MSFFNNLLSSLKGNRKKSSLIDIRETIQDDTFCDIQMSITEKGKDNTYNVFIIKGTYNGNVVGLQIRIITKMPFGISKEGNVNTETGFVPQGLIISTIGKETELFLKALAELYNIPNNRTFSTSEITATVFSLNSTDTDLNTPGYYKFKIFFNEDEDESLYSEMYMNINISEGIFELHEKDPEYRTAIINTFTSAFSAEST